MLRGAQRRNPPVRLHHARRSRAILIDCRHQFTAQPHPDNTTPDQYLVAIVNNEFTLKRLAREKGRLALKPENKACPVLRLEGSHLGWRPEGSPFGGRPKEDAGIHGMVAGLLRKCKQRLSRQHRAAEAKTFPVRYAA